MHFNPETFKVAMQILRNVAKGTNHHRNHFCLYVSYSSNFYSQFRTVIDLLTFFLCDILVSWYDYSVHQQWGIFVYLALSTNWFPEGPDIKCLVIFLDFHFNLLNTNKRVLLSGANQNSRLGTYKNTNLTLKTTEWMIYRVLSLYYLHLFPPLTAVSLPG